MTNPAEPEQRYIVPESLISRIKSVIIEDATHEYDTKFFEKIRQHPYPPVQQRIEDAIKELEKLDTHLELMWNDGRPTNSGAIATTEASIAMNIKSRIAPIIALLREVK